MGSVSSYFFSHQSPFNKKLFKRLMIVMANFSFAALTRFINDNNLIVI